jgi:hypothetical protein
MVFDLERVQKLMSMILCYYIQFFFQGLHELVRSIILKPFYFGIPFP